MTTFVAPPDQTKLVLNNGDQLIVNSGGEATATTVSGGIIEVLKGGTTIGTTINRGLEVDSGTAINTTLNETGAFQVSLQVKDGGTAIGTIINSSSQQTTQLIISSGSTSFDTIINGGLRICSERRHVHRHENQQRRPRTRIWQFHENDYQQRRHRECRRRRDFYRHNDP